jgi:diaminopimelate decarboxylase
MEGGKIVARYLDSNFLHGIADKFGTPFYLYDAKTIRDNYRALKVALYNEVEIFYSIKANPNLTLCSFLKQSGANAEVCSLLELETAIRAGFAPQNIIFVGPAKSQKEIQKALEIGIYALICESFNELNRIMQLANKMDIQPSIIFRINPDFVCKSAPLKMGGKPSQFGIDLAEFIEHIPLIKSLPFKIKGIHIYNGTRIINAHAIHENMAAILQLAVELEKLIGYQLEAIDIGGGLGVPYFDNEKELDLKLFAKLMKTLLTSFRSNHPQKRIILESGRFLVASSGVFVSSVVDKKISKNEEFLIIDGGINCHLSAVGIGTIVKRNFPIKLFKKNNKHQPMHCYQITGPLCTPGDLVGKDVQLEKAEIGDLIAISMSGAYGPTASPGLFLGHGFPNEILFDEGRLYLIRESDSVNDMLAKQKGPIF